MPQSVLVLSILYNGEDFTVAKDCNKRTWAFCAKLFLIKAHRYFRILSMQKGAGGVVSITSPFESSLMFSAAAVLVSSPLMAIAFFLVPGY